MGNAILVHLKIISESGVENCIVSKLSLLEPGDCIIYRMYKYFNILNVLSIIDREF